MKTLKTAALTLALLAGVSAPAAAQYRMGNTNNGRESGAGAAQPALNLTPDQKSRISALRDAAMTKAAPLRAQMQSKMLEMKQLWSSANPDRQAILAKQDEMDSIHRQMRTVWTDFGLQVHSILTPEQRVVWLQSQKGMMGMGPGMGGHHMGGGADAGAGMWGGECAGCPMCPGGQQ
jgi:Spy/CpxP family protein refolding chaperone